MYAMCVLCVKRLTQQISGHISESDLIWKESMNNWLWIKWKEAQGAKSSEAPFLSYQPIIWWVLFYSESNNMFYLKANSLHFIRDILPFLHSVIFFPANHMKSFIWKQISLYLHISSVTMSPRHDISFQTNNTIVLSDCENSSESMIFFLLITN